jgi:hypothetical protein
MGSCAVKVVVRPDEWMMIERYWSGDSLSWVKERVMVELVSGSRSFTGWAARGRTKNDAVKRQNATPQGLKPLSLLWAREIQGLSLGVPGGQNGCAPVVGKGEAIAVTRTASGFFDSASRRLRGLLRSE